MYTYILGSETSSLTDDALNGTSDPRSCDGRAESSHFPPLPVFHWSWRIRLKQCLFFAIDCQEDRTLFFNIPIAYLFFLTP
jgi:hypothetical protein